jgi:hypothetical protein
LVYRGKHMKAFVQRSCHQARLKKIKFSTRAWLECGTVGFPVQMWNGSRASICASNRQYVNSTCSRHLSLLNEMKFIVTFGSHREEISKRE